MAMLSPEGGMPAGTGDGGRLAGWKLENSGSWNRQHEHPICETSESAVDFRILRSYIG